MLNLFGKSASPEDLIARKKYTQALVVMREQFRRKSPDAPARQQFAELLILADRRGEAIPILLGLADEHLRFGFIDKAKDALGRIEQLESGRPDVAQRLRRIAAKNDSPEPRAAAGATVLSAQKTENEPAGSDEWDTDLSAPIAMVLEPPTLHDPIPVELAPFDLFPVGNAVLVNPAPLAEREAPVSHPIRRRASAPLSR